MFKSVSLIEEFLSYLKLERNRSLLTVEAYRRDLTQLFSFLSKDAALDSDGNVDDSILLQADARDIRHWLARESEKGCGPRSLRRKAQGVRSFFNWAVIVGKTERNPVTGLQLAKAPKPLPGFVTDEEMQQVEKIRLATDPMLEMRNHMIVELLYTCGLRKAELRSITDADIDHSRAELRIHGKGGKIRIIPLAPSVLSVITEWQTMRDGCSRDRKAGEGNHNCPLIPGRHGNPLSASSIGNIVRLALCNSKAYRRSPHTLRHSFATAMLNGGADIMTVKEFLGHSSLSSTQIYTHLNFKELQRDYSKAHPRGGNKECEKK